MDAPNIQKGFTTTTPTEKLKRCSTEYSVRHILRNYYGARLKPNGFFFLCSESYIFKTTSLTKAYFFHPIIDLCQFERKKIYTRDSQRLYRFQIIRGKNVFNILSRTLNDEEKKCRPTQQMEKNAFIYRNHI